MKNLKNKITFRLNNSNLKKIFEITDELKISYSELMTSALEIYFKTNNINNDFNLIEEIGCYKKRITKKIYQYDLDYNLINEFESIKIASKETNITIGTISSNCRNLIKYPKKFIWSYEILPTNNQLNQ